MSNDIEEYQQTQYQQTPNQQTQYHQTPNQQTQYQQAPNQQSQYQQTQYQQTQNQQTHYQQTPNQQTPNQQTQYQQTPTREKINYYGLVDSYGLPIEPTEQAPVDARPVLPTPTPIDTYYQKTPFRNSPEESDYYKGQINLSGAPVRPTKVAPSGAQTFNQANTTPEPLKVSVYRIPTLNQVIVDDYNSKPYRNTNALKILDPPKSHSFRASPYEAPRSNYHQNNLIQNYRRPKSVTFKPSPKDPLYEVASPTDYQIIRHQLSDISNKLKPIRQPLYNAANLMQLFYRQARNVLRSSLYHSKASSSQNKLF